MTGGAEMRQIDTSEIHNLPIKTVASHLGIKVLRGNKAMCFTGHDKNTPSLSFHLKKNYWHCFGCDSGGDPVMLIDAGGLERAIDTAQTQLKEQQLSTMGGRSRQLTPIIVLQLTDSVWSRNFQMPQNGDEIPNERN